MGVANIEMECDQVGAFCTKMGIRSGMVCTVICNRLKGVQVPHTPKQVGHSSVLVSVVKVVM
jgi:uridine phosphorylase